MSESSKKVPAPDSRDDRAKNPLQPGKRAVDDVFSLVYEELKRLASFIRRNESSVTINSTALVHEAWMKLKDSRNLAGFSAPHFKAIAANAMRQILVDAARKKNSRKRGGGGEYQFVQLDESADKAASTGTDILALNDALKRLAELNPRQAEMVTYRFFTGLNVTETAEVMGISESVVERDWRAAKAWLAVEVRADGARSGGAGWAQ